MKALLALGFFCVAALTMAGDVVYNPKLALQRMKVGDTLSFKLEALPGAGYIWQPTPLGHNNLKYVGSKTATQKGAGIGGKVTMTLQFKATSAGDATIALQYGRPWELKKGGKATKMIVAKITVN